jgi:hypothetical protein
MHIANAVDATYRADLRELNELNFARFDAKVEQRLAAMEARLDARIDRLAASLERKLDSQVAMHAFAQIDARFDRMRAELEQGLRKYLGWTILMWISVLAAVFVRT